MWFLHILNLYLSKKALNSEFTKQEKKRNDIRISFFFFQLESGKKESNLKKNFWLFAAALTTNDN